MGNITKNLICPKCKEKLVLKNKSFYCNNNHCYDVSKDGYVNLLLVNNKKTKQPGDDELMVKARAQFLEKGYFEKLAKAICSYVKKEEKSKHILDAGCGTGYYLKFLAENAPENNFLGIDISKPAVKFASHYDKKSLYVVSSIFDMPILSKSIDIILNVFAPKPEDEFDRILSKEGIIIEVVPGKDHLKELKQNIFQDRAKQNQEKFAFLKFKLENIERISYKEIIQESDDIINLLKMTPYWYTGAKGKIEDSDIGKIEITFDFLINIWRKNESI